ncbi:methyltransferase domain-containing protein [Amylibacter sp. SFDW26]|uniref:class I SAM-dependent methyltransferase n=1 Tax=Amylibacter sp. SFDW26 TaxID=2652722 RepID=UPI0012627F05|nr:class I SAM-dependent methyltransferase [Amylibacter sp. SFDW26]KAB7613507.1 methyltransferase domain-containing protein [Amylibacter sp. SFDW26]
MSKDEFDEYRDNYVETVEKSVEFSGLRHSFFQESKALIIKDLIEQYLPDNSRKTLLDVGCGVGALHPYIDKMFTKIHGVDVSAESITKAKINNPMHDYQYYEGHTLPFADNSVDMSLAVCVMHHVPTNLWDNFLSEKTRVVRPGGLVCLIEHNPINPATRLSVARCPFDEDAVLLGARPMRKRLRQANLDCVKTRHFVFFPTNKPIIRSIERRIGWLPLGAQYAAIGIPR